jgi:hypothetical protein
VAYEERIKAFMERQGETALVDMFNIEHEKEVATFFRLCIDLRMLNQKMIPDIFPLPRIDDLVESVPRNCGRFSISDVADAFFTCELREGDRHKTGFRTHNRQMQFCVLPQGLCNSPSIFSRMIAKTFEGMERSRFSAYIDDVLNHTQDFEEHLSTQQEMYTRLRGSRLTLKVSKTHLNQKRVKFLGHILTKEGRYPDPKAVEAINEWKDPETAKEVRSFLGATLYYREYIHNYSDIAMPLYDLIRKGVVVRQVWNQEVHGDAVKRLKAALISKPVLMPVDNTKPFRLKVDACRKGRGLGCILEQQNDEGKWQPVSYYSSSLSDAEREYSATELECKALHDCIIHYAIYLKHIPHFEVFSDHFSLKYMVKSDRMSTNGRLMRYLMDLQGYNFSLYYRKGIENQDADAVSRLLRQTDSPVYLSEDELREESGPVDDKEMEKAKKVKRITIKAEKEAQKAYKKMAKAELREMAEINDRILEAGVENLESETGRAKFYKNLQELGMVSRRETVDETIREMTPGGQVKIDEEEVGNKINEVMINFTQEIKMANEILGEQEGEEEMWEKTSWVGMAREAKTPVELYWLECSADECEEIRALQLMAVSRGVTTKMKSRLVEKAAEYNVEEFVAKRERLKERWVMLNALTTSEEECKLVHCAKRHNLRVRKKIDYAAEDKVQPNWRNKKEEPPRRQVTIDMERSRRVGYKNCEVRESMLRGAGDGLFSKKKFKKNEIICSYEGVLVSYDKLSKEYPDRDYVAGVEDHEGNLIYCDSPVVDSCYGRYCNDPLDDLIVNAKVLMEDGKIVVVAWGDIEPGDEIFISYMGDYWYSRLDRLPEDLQERIKRNYPGEKRVDFGTNDIELHYKEAVSPATGMGRNLKKTKVLAQKPPKNRRTRLREERIQDQGGEEETFDEPNRIRHEDFAYENVHQCEELAEKLRTILNGRKFIDDEDGKLYEVYQVRYDEESEMIIGFRKPMTGTANRNDGSAYAVYGKSGLYELTELYLLDHPEEDYDPRWPKEKSEWAEMQRLDGNLMEIINRITGTASNEVEIGKNIYRLVPTDYSTLELLVILTESNKGTIERCVVPEWLRKKALNIYHEGFAHMGSAKMYATMRQNFYWEGMERDVTTHVKRCINCKLRKSYQRRPVVPIVQYGKVERVLDRVHMDLTGPLPTTKGKNKYIFVIKDFLSKYVWLIPLADKRMETVALAFVNEFCCQAGLPGTVISDQGNEFVNQVMKRVASILNISRISTTPYNPRADGFVENHNKTLKDQLFHFVDNLKQDDWDIYLPVVQLMYNTTVSLATGYTPMLLMTGREARMPSFEHVDANAPTMAKEMADNQYVMKMIENMRAYQDFAVAHAGKNKEKSNVKIRKPLEFVEYEVGQQFLRVRRPVSSFKSVIDEEEWKISMKLLERYEGPYTIIRKINPILYDADINGKEKRVHAVNMKPY